MASSQLLIIGSRGIVGSAIAAAAGERALKAARMPVASSVLPFDALTDQVTELLARMETRPKAAVLAFGISGVHACATDPIGTRQLNVDRVVAVATAAARLGVLPVVLSSDAVFNGTPVLWSEADVPNPICEYGRQKLAAEQAIAAAGITHLTIRLSRVIADLPGRRDLLFQWCDRIIDRAPVTLATDLSPRSRRPTSAELWCPSSISACVA
jgi:dTDP-4-dehydrorhamnose reductase